MRSRAQLREIDISSYLKGKKVLSRSHNVVEAFAKLLRKRQALMPKMVVAGHLAITFLLSLLFLRARSALPPLDYLIVSRAIRQSGSFRRDRRKQSSL